MHPTSPIPTHLTRHTAVGKARRPIGDPVAALKDFTRFIPNPAAAPRTLAVAFDVFDPKASAAAEAAGKLVFHCVGDVGGVNGTATQDALAVAMEDQLKAAAPHDMPRFFYILGDVVYYNGEETLYKTEFYEPYQYYPALIFAIPGNHDGDTQVEKQDPPDTEPSLMGFNLNFCASVAQHVTPYRMSMTQPYAYWTMDAPFVTILGLYSNVEGSLDARGTAYQQQYLVEQMKAADPKKKLILTVHHPPYSLDGAHGGTPDILNAIDRAVVASGRHPDAVLSGHVHDYQRFTRTVGGRKTPYVVAGAGGYANDARSMHQLQPGITNQPLPYQTTLPDVVLESFQVTQPGFLRITADSHELSFEYFVVGVGHGRGDAARQLQGVSVHCPVRVAPQGWSMMPCGLRCRGLFVWCCLFGAGGVCPEV